MLKKYKSEKAITLVALVVTVVVLLILAGISINLILSDNGIIAKAKEAKQKTETAKQEEEYELESLLGTITSISPSETGYTETKGVNSPKITKGMIPIKWENGNWVVCSQDDPNWYYYESKMQANSKMQWANIMLSDGKYKSDSVQEGQVVQESELGSMYVWIPRYAYKIAGEKDIDVTFLKGNTNVGTDDVTYTTDENTDTKTTAIVHPAFNFGGVPLTGIWVAKFEASGTNQNGDAVGNTKDGVKGQLVEPDPTTIAKSLPNKISWRHITIGESEFRALAIAGSAKESYGLDYANSHLIKNSEWGAVAYLCYSDYGEVPMINGTGSSNSDVGYYDLYTGQGPSTKASEGRYDYSEGDLQHRYNQELGILASTTKNVTGIYDMNGGAWERVAAYLDNEHSSLNTYGVSSNGTKYFENGKLNSAYSSIWDAYKVSDEEKNNQINISDTETLTKYELWNTSKLDLPYQRARYRLTKEIFDNMANHKGIGVNEVSSTFSFYAPYTNSEGTNTWGWFTTPEQTVADPVKQNYVSTWDGDYVLIGHGATPFVVRGGSCNYGSGAGVLCSYITGGHAYLDYGFRSVLVL